MLLAGRVALISGGASRRGLGQATARMFVAEGATVVIADLDPAGPEPWRPNSAGCWLFLASDLSCYGTGAEIEPNGGMLIH